MPLYAAQQPGSLRSTPGKTKHQKIAHKILTEAGYRFVRIDGNEHNQYRNEFGQRASVVCSPRSSENGITELKALIRRQQREREASMPTATQTQSASTVDIVDQLVAMGDQSMMRPPARKDTPAGKARIAAYTSWLRRVLEKHAPIHGKHVEDATKRLGFKAYDLVNARKALDVKVMREGGPTGRWLIALPHQVPEGAITRRNPAEEPLGVQVEPRERIESVNLETGEIKLAPPAPVREAMESFAGEALTPLTPTNGKPQPSEAQAAMLMLAETLGLHVPGEEARQALLQADRALVEAREALSNAIASLA